MHGSGGASQIRRARDIARQFSHLEQDDAVAAVTQHIERVWERRMLAQFLEAVDAESADLDPIVRAVAEGFRR